MEMALVRVADVTHAGGAVDQLHEGLLGPALPIELAQLLLGDLPGRGHITARQLPLVERQQMRHKANICPPRAQLRFRSLRGPRQDVELLLDFGRVPVCVDLVGERVLGQGDEMHLIAAAATGAGDPLLGVDDHVGDQALLGQRRQRQQRRRGVAARIGDQVGGADPIAVELGQPVDRVG